MDEMLEDLVVRARKRDAEAFAELIERFERSALALAYSVLHNADRAGDVVQEAFIRAWQELGKLQEVGRFGGWLMQIVRNLAIDARRRIKPALTEYPELAGKGPEPSFLLESEERAAEIEAALKTLDETTRAAVMMRYYEGKSAKEIAEVLELSPPAVDMRLSRGRAVLRDQLAHLITEEVGEWS